MAWMLGIVKNGGNDIQNLGFFRDELQMKNLHLRDWNFGKWLNLCTVFESIDKKYTLRFLEWPPFSKIKMGVQ